MRNLSYGAGFKCGDSQLDYTYTDHEKFEASHRISLTMAFGDWRGSRRLESKWGRRRMAMPPFCVPAGRPPGAVSVLKVGKFPCYHALVRRIRQRGASLSDDELIGLAREVKENAHAPYSGFRVGAALLARDGRVFTGVNVENASIGLSVCAERNAIARAVADGVTDFARLAIVTDSTDEPTMPCGVCRQVIWEFTRDLPIIIESTPGARVHTTIAELFPRPFTSYKN